MPRDAGYGEDLDVGTVLPFWAAGEKLDPPLSRKEFDILEVLYLNRGNAVSRDEIATSGWPERPDGDVTPEEIDQYIRRLRRRVEENSSDPKLIVTMRGYGYRIPQPI